MMVEAGGTEKSFAYYADGAPKVDEARARQRARRLQGLDQGVDRPAAPAPGQRDRHQRADHAARVHAGRRLRRRRVRRRRARRRRAARRGRSRSPPRPSATPPPTPSPTPPIAELCGTADAPGEFAGREKEVKEAVRSLTKKLVRHRIVERGRAHRRPWRRRPAPRVGRGRRAADGARLGPVPARRDPGAQRVHAGHAAHEPARSTRSPRRRTKRFLHHYNMPPWANGETGRVGSPKRREIGHGALAGRAILPVVPSQEEFAYTLRLVSEVLSSNGSTSMGSVCASSLSLMDAGVPIKAPVAGIAMGLVYADGKYIDAHRHPRCRGRVRRHGLQGRRHRRRDHRPAARHQDRRHPRRRADRRARPGQGRPPRRSSR